MVSIEDFKQEHDLKCVCICMWKSTLATVWKWMEGEETGQGARWDLSSKTGPWKWRLWPMENVVWELVRGMKKAEGGVWDEFLVSGSDGHVDSGAISWAICMGGEAGTLWGLKSSIWWWAWVSWGISKWRYPASSLMCESSLGERSGLAIH